MSVTVSKGPGQDVSDCIKGAGTGMSVTVSKGPGRGCQ